MRRGVGHFDATLNVCAVALMRFDMHRLAKIYGIPNVDTNANNLNAKRGELTRNSRLYSLPLSFYLSLLLRSTLLALCGRAATLFEPSASSGFHTVHATTRVGPFSPANGAGGGGGSATCWQFAHTYTL